MKKGIMFLSAVFFIVLTAGAQKAEVFSPSGKAIKGYDPVAFFKEGKPVKGADSLSYQWKDATWLFSSTKNLETFKADPENYAPQYGGYCAYGSADGVGHKAPTDVDTWTIVNGKLYFNYNKKVKEYWNKDQEKMIKKADTNWPAIKDKE